LDNPGIPRPGGSRGLGKVALGSLAALSRNGQRAMAEEENGQQLLGDASEKECWSGKNGVGPQKATVDGKMRK
jgi:hypothetical protein